MKKNAKKVVASLMATMTVMSAMASECLAAGNGRIGVESYYFYNLQKEIYVGDINEDGAINSADVWMLYRIGDCGYAFWASEKVCDCNGDHYVNSKDVDALASYVVSH